MVFMIIVKSVNNVPIRLTIERWDHIVKRHPELHEQKDKVVQCVALPEIVQIGDFGEVIAIKFYEKTPLTSKYLVVVYKEINANDGFIITAYYTSKPSERRIIIWKR
jgi:hypothetical protein